MRVPQSSFLWPIIVSLIPLSAAAGTSFQSSRVLDGVESFAVMNANDSASARESMLEIQKFLKGDFASLKQTNELAAPITESFQLGDVRTQDETVVLNLAAKINILENSPQAKLDVQLYSTDAIEASALQHNQDARGLALQLAEKKQFCAMTLAQGFVMALKGTCAVVNISVPSGGRVKVYQNGKFAAKSLAALLSLDEVRAQLQTSPADGLRLLDQYLTQETASLSEQDMTKILENVSTTTQKVSLLRKMGPHLTSVSGETLLAIVNDISSPSYGVDAIRALRGKAKLSGQQLNQVLETIGSPSYAVEALRVLVVDTTFQSGDVAKVVHSIGSPSYQSDGVKVIEAHLQPNSIGLNEMTEILEEVGSPSYQFEVLRALIGKIRSEDLGGVKSYVLDNFPPFYARDAAKLILDR